MSRRCVLSCGIVAASCSLWPAVLSSHDPITTTVLFNREILQIFQKKCLQCHSANTVAMPLTTYREARPWARAIKEEVLERRMPPWQAVRGYGRFANDVSLTQREIDFIVSWVDGGVPKGDDKESPGVPEDGRWPHGDPDLALAAGDGHLVEAGRPDYTRRVVLPAGLPSARSIAAIDFLPGDRRVVRGALFFREDSGQWLGGWTPWHGSSSLPDGVAHRLPARSRIVMELHYRGTDEAVTDRSALGLYFSDGRGARRASDLVIQAPAVTVPPKAVRHRVQKISTLTADMRAFALLPAMSAAGRSIEVTALKPDGAIEVLLWVNEQKPAWPTPYQFTEPIPLPRGTKIRLTAYYDNPGDAPITDVCKAIISLYR